MSVTRYPSAYDMLDMNTSYRNSTADPVSFMPAFRVLREKARMRGYEIKQLSNLLISTNIQPPEAKSQFAEPLLQPHAAGVARWPSNRSAG